MPVQVATGEFNVGAGLSGVPTTLPFDPTNGCGLILSWSGRTSNGVARANVQAGYGIAAYNNGQESVAGTSKDTGTSACQQGERDDSVIHVLTTAGADDGKAGITWSSTGFTITPSTAFTNNIIVKYWAVSLPALATVTAAEPATATTSQTTGLPRSPKCGILPIMGGVSSFSSPSQTAADFNLSFGVFLRNPSGTIKNGLMAGASDDGFATTKSGTYVNASECLARFGSTLSATILSRAACSAIGPTDFTLTYAAVEGAGTHQFPVLLFFDGVWSLDTLTCATSTGVNMTITPGFPALGGLVAMSGNTSFSVLGTGSGSARHYLGMHAGVGSEQAIATRDTNGQPGGQCTTGADSSHSIYAITNGLLMGDGHLTAIGPTTTTFQMTTATTALVGWVVSVGDDTPPPRRVRLLEEPAEDVRARRLFAPPPAAAVAADQPFVRARRLEEPAPEEPRARRLSSAPQGIVSFTADTSTAAVDLTAIGTSDWRTWQGTGVPADVVRKVSGANQISDWTLIGGVGPSWTPAFEPNVVQWSDGDPVPAGSHAGILSTTGNFLGFLWTVPADQTPRTLHLYLDVFGITSASVQADVSDLSFPTRLVAKFVDGEWNVHVTYQSAAPGQTVTIRFRVFGASPEARVRGLALAGPAVPSDMPFVRRPWQALASWDVEELIQRRPRAPILPVVTPDSPPPRARARLLEVPEDERGLRRSLAPIVPAVVVDNPPPRARARQTETPEDETRARRPPAPIAAPAGPPPRTVRRREEEPEVITGLRGRKLVPPPVAPPDPPPPRAGRSNWRVAWDTWEPVELLRKVYRLVFPGVNYPPPVPPLHIVENDVVRTVVADAVVRSVVENDTVREVSPMKPRKVGDTADVFSGTLYNNGAPRSLAGSTVKLYMWDSRTHALKINGAVCLVEPSGTGTWSYQPIAADVDTAGEWEYDLEETLASGRLAVYPSKGYGKFVTEERVG